MEGLFWWINAEGVPAPLGVEQLDAWRAWMRDTTERRVLLQDSIASGRLVTRFAGYDAAMGAQDAPRLWHTALEDEMGYGLPFQSYSSEEEARTGHARLLELLRAASAAPSN